MRFLRSNSGGYKKKGLRRLSESAFALPVVLMVSLALATLITVLLDRFMSQTRSVSGIVRSYENYHAGRGLHQLLEAWMRNTSTSRITGRLGENGLAMTVKLSEGMTPNANSEETARIYLSDGQGSILSQVSSLPAEDVALGQAILNAAKELDASDGTQQNAAHDEGAVARRESGPLAVSVRSASVKTLRAAVMGATGNEKTDEIVNELIRAREDGSMTTATLSEAANKAGITGDARARLLKAITVEPQVWNVLAEVFSEKLIGGGLILRYRGVAVISASGGATGATSARSVIRQWTREDVN